MKTGIFAAMLAVFLPCLINASCPAMSCPAEMDTPVAEYLFNNNINDTSGHGNDGWEYTPSRPVAYYNNIGGRPGYCAGNFTFDSHTGFYVPACVIYRDEGEIEWYHYVTNPAETHTNYFLNWNNITTAIGFYPGDAALFGTYVMRVGFSALPHYEEFAGEWVKYDQWQHCSFQWGPFGTRIIVDGEIVAGSSLLWNQGSRVEPYVFIGTWHGAGTGFSGYIDDVRFWPCAGHGTPTITLTLSSTKTHTATPTFTITPSHTISQTHTITETETLVMTDTVTETSTVTETFTVTPSLTESPYPTASHTATFTPTITNTITASPTPAESKLIGAFPNPAAGPVKIIFCSAVPCKAELEVYTVSGEKSGSCSMEAATGMNALVFRLKNPSEIALSSGIYLYRLSLSNPGEDTRVFNGKFAVLK